MRLFLVLLSLLIPVNQGEIIDESVFWSNLQQTNALLREADSASITQVNALWQDFDQVRLSDGSIITIDTGWLTLPSTASRDEIRQVQTRVQALLDFQASRASMTAGTENLLSVLDNVLADERFQYAEETLPPTLAPGSPSQSSGTTINLNPGASASQLFLIVVGLLAVAGLFTYLRYNLKIQQAGVKAKTDDADDPTTPHSAQEMAEQSEEVRDYRAAIRYLYLYSLLLLDERGIIRYDPAKTNREHLLQVDADSSLKELLYAIVTIFDRVWYGFAPVDEALYRRFRQNIEQLQQYPS